MKSADLAEAYSFRDPNGRVLAREGRVFRLVTRDTARFVDDLLQRPRIRSCMSSGKLIETFRPAPNKVPAELRDPTFVVYEHERIPFVSYPFEWSPAMLSAAGQLTIDLSMMLLDEGSWLQDAKPANVLFRGSQPVFIDILSIVPRERGAYLWLAANQLESTFLLPLILNNHSSIPLSWSLQDSHAGVSHSQAARILGFKRWFRSDLIWSVALPAALEGKDPRSSDQTKRRNDEAAKFILSRTYARYRERLAQLVTTERRSYWSRYTDARAHYSTHDVEQKTNFIGNILQNVCPRTVLDIGANTGEFSKLAAQTSQVVAIDIDEESVTSIFRDAQLHDLDIQPLVGDFGRPSPGLGWQNAEHTSLLDRIRRRFDIVMMLAVIHHLRITSGVPIDMILNLLADIAYGHAIIEHVPPSDPMFQQLARGRAVSYDDCEHETFRSALATRFEIQSALTLGNNRTLYWVKSLRS